MGLWESASQYLFLRKYMQSVLLPIQWTLEMERSLISSQIKQPVWAIERYVHSRRSALFYAVNILILKSLKLYLNEKRYPFYPHSSIMLKINGKYEISDACPFVSRAGSYVNGKWRFIITKGKRMCWNNLKINYEKVFLIYFTWRVKCG